MSDGRATPYRAAMDALRAAVLSLEKRYIPPPYSCGDDEVSNTFIRLQEVLDVLAAHEKADKPT